MPVARLGQGRWARQTEFRRETLGVKRADAKDDERPGVAENRMLKFFGKLGDLLIGCNERETPLARLREDRCEAVGCEVLKFIDVQREVAALIFS